MYKIYFRPSWVKIKDILKATLYLGFKHRLEKLSNSHFQHFTSTSAIKVNESFSYYILTLFKKTAGVKIYDGPKSEATLAVEHCGLDNPPAFRSSGQMVQIQVIKNYLK